MQGLGQEEAKRKTKRKKMTKWSVVVVSAALVAAPAAQEDR